MRGLLGIGAAIASLMHASVLNMPVFLMPDAHGPAAKSNRIKTGATYPHSSARQRARYARQIAAGQIKLERV
ncbi:hypothetical protein SM0020_12390 [Sinorhizobium meliloti CCNWSX0020]|uniref:Uncharacterized protein n=1 Tax=Sinorhizobium meliloti CCNWSX0020 TaxID=1107881 RepID=H0FZ44_RHIML|nr:hypothetical protein [Sinorhizobium meliloti]EHK77724.1 hypothetical protein SM0020_12390 [Sinorhizobium meliloti CCNWSX0020]